MKIALYMAAGAGWRPYGLIDAGDPDAAATHALHAGPDVRAFNLDGTAFAAVGLLGLPPIAGIAAVAEELPDPGSD